MNRSPAAALRLLAAALFATVTYLAAGPGVPAAFADGSNTETGASTSVQQQGTATASDGGVALAGPAIATNVRVVNQMNVQNVAGPAAMQGNVTQDATNTADVDQFSLAVSGDATATDGLAATGSARAMSIVIVQQLNVQVVAGWAPSDGVSQTASNTADVGQTTVAVSGDAAADGGGSSAASGQAQAVSVTVVQQRNIQVYVGRPDVEGSVEQTAANAFSGSQLSGAITGDASATSGSQASTGDAGSMTQQQTQQTSFQITGP